MAAPSESVSFEERQRFRQPWLLAVLLGACAVAGCAVFAAVRSRRGSPWMALAVLLPGLLVWLLYRLDMGVRVDGQALSVRFSPL